MVGSAYRFRAPTTVAIRERNGFRITEVSADSLFFSSSTEPDRNHMLGGVCNGETIVVFARDLEERAEVVGAEVPIVAGATAERNPSIGV